MQHFEWLRSEGYDGKYCAVADFIRKYRAQHPASETSVFIPQNFPAGDAYQFDWSTETVRLGGKEQRVQVAHFRLCHSRAFFIRAYFRQKLEMLIDVHNRAFSFWNGVPQRGIYDNMKSVVVRIGQGKERVFNKHFLVMMNHFVIEPVACTPASGWEKGQVERQVGVLRSKLFKPMLSFENIGDLNQYLEDQCRRLMQETAHPQNKDKTVAEVFEEERVSLSTFYPYAGRRTETVRVSSLSLVRIDSNRYSVPCSLVGRIVLLQITADQIKVIVGDQCVATHERIFGNGQTSYNPWHYLSALKHKPGALRNGEPFAQWTLPKPVKALQKHLLQQPKGDRAMVQLLTLIADYGEDVGVTAAAIALEEGVPTVEAVLNIIHRLTEPDVPSAMDRDIPLHMPPKADCAQYNRLLKGAQHAPA